MSRVGPNPSSSSASSDVPGLGFLALTSTPFAWSCAVSDALSQNVGTWVENSVVGFAFLLAGRVDDLARERALDRVALRRDRLHLPRVDLVQEVRAERDLHPRLRSTAARAAPTAS